MSPNLTSSFLSYNLTEEERIQGSILTAIQKICIQNQIAQFSEERLMLPLLEENRDRAHELIGSINALRYLLSLSFAAEKEMAEEIKKNENRPS